MSAEYRICRECADTGATVRGNDGWHRHEACAKAKDQRPYVEGVQQLAGVGVTAYTGGKVSVYRRLTGSVTNRMAITRLASLYGELGEDYETLHPTRQFRANGEDGRIEVSGE
jgi:hypothetical protein